jgi:hypothetical protein
MSLPEFPLHNPWVSVPRWIARLLSLLWIVILFGLFVAMVPENPAWSAIEVLTGCTLFVVWLGLLFGWYNELWGGIIVCSGSVLFTIFSWLSYGHFSSSWIWLISLLLLPGILWIYLGVKSRPPDYS